MFRAIRHPLRFVDGILDRVISIIGAVAFSQFPQFFGQYMQRLGGHLAEAKLALVQYIVAAEVLDLTLDEYIREHLESGSEVFTSSGQSITGGWFLCARLTGQLQPAPGKTLCLAFQPRLKDSPMLWQACCWAGGFIPCLSH